MLDRNQRAWASKLAERRIVVPPEPACSPPDRRPRPGDIIITRHPSQVHGHYTIGRFDQQPQLSCGSREKALTLARAFAGRHNVEIWEAAPGRFTSLMPRGRRDS